jgi:sialate O-acetylesterase
MIRGLILCLHLSGLSFYGWAQASLVAASIFGDNMVIQQGIKAPVWGKAKPLQDISISINGNIARTKADKTGKWIARLPVFKTGGPFKMVISSSQDSIVFNNVLIGEVWLASGQSNMQMSLTGVNDAEKEISEANYPKIRFFDVGRNIANKPLENVNGSWKVCNPLHSKSFSAVAYFFARRLHQQKNVPVGIISASWGSTPAEAFVSGESLVKHPDFKDSVQGYKVLQENWETLYKNYLIETAKATQNSTKKPTLVKEKNYPTALYNAMIAPLVPYGIKG